MWSGPRLVLGVSVSKGCLGTEKERPLGPFLGVRRQARQKVGVDIKDLEKGSEGCPAGKQVAERTASPGSDGGGSKDPESLARSVWPRTTLRHSPGLVGEEWPAVSGLGRNYTIWREKLHADVLGRHCGLEKERGGGGST